jgi:hypothetical protein
MRILCILITLVCIPAAAATFGPLNDMKIYPDLDPVADALQRQSYDKALDMVYRAYAPNLSKNGWKLEIRRLWSDSTVNAETWQEGNRIIIAAYGGLARYPGMNAVSAYAAVTCHELGHSLGGSPRYPGEPMSVEGQADHWAFARCMRSIGYSRATHRAAGLMLSKVLAAMGSEDPPTIPGPKLPPYNGVMKDHPPAQCRLNEMLGATDGLPRNKCWFNPAILD